MLSALHGNLNKLHQQNVLLFKIIFTYVPWICILLLLSNTLQMYWLNQHPWDFFHVACCTKLNKAGNNTHKRLDVYVWCWKPWISFLQWCETSLRVWLLNHGKFCSNYSSVPIPPSVIWAVNNPPGSSETPNILLRQKWVNAHHQYASSLCVTYCSLLSAYTMQTM